ncbi:MAG: dihydropteroate synthase [Candidatus Zixiibacteriota bacterium]
MKRPVPSAIELKGMRRLTFGQPLVMGILNVTPDSFSDGGKFLATDKAVAHALELQQQGADIIDVGGESTRPGAAPVTLDEELGRVIPVIQALRKESSIPISIDTYKAEVARQAVTAGADIINDVSAFRFDPDMAAVAARTAVPVILMHMLGKPRDMQVKPEYRDCVAEIGEFFDERIAVAQAAGIAGEKIILDPGIGFGKRIQDNLDILRRCGEFARFGRPLLVGASRKSFIAQVPGGAGEPSNRIGGSIAAAIMAVANGASIVRVHDVAATVEALHIWRAIQGDE